MIHSACVHVYLNTVTVRLCCVSNIRHTVTGAEKGLDAYVLMFWGATLLCHLVLNGWIFHLTLCTVWMTAERQILRTTENKIIYFCVTLENSSSSRMKHRERSSIQAKQQENK